ncbi:KIF1-binding protein [Pelomyxa schiedti]|nr:KIF1-binding protein [Pelomyxa schiedti]
MSAEGAVTTSTTELSTTVSDEGPTKTTEIPSVVTTTAEGHDASADTVASEAIPNPSAASVPLSPSPPASAPTVTSTTTTSSTSTSSSELPLAEFERVMEQVEDLLKVQDPPETPFKSIYKSDDVLKELLSRLNSDSEDQADMKSVIHYVLGINALNSEDNAAGESNLHKLLSRICPLDNSASALPVGDHRRGWGSIAIDSLNRLGVLASDRSNHEEAERYLKQAEAVYLQIKRRNEAEVLPFTHTGYHNEIESLYTHTLYYLAQMYNINSKKSMAAQYCYETLKRQRASNTYNSEEWALNCVSLAAYYVEHYMFFAAEQCLSIAAATLPVTTSEENKINCSIARAHWLLDFFKFKYKQHIGELKSISPCGVETPEPLFGGENAPSPSELVQFSTIDTYEQAYVLFSRIRDLLISGMKYYVLDGFTSDHMKLLNDLCKLYRLLISYDTNLERRCKLQEKRISLLEPLVSQLNPQFYNFELQELYDKLGNMHSEYADQLLKVQAATNSHELDYKINRIINSSITYFSRLVRCFEGKPLGGNEDAVLAARFSRARLYTQLISSDLEVCVENMKKALVEYSWLSDYGEKNSPKNFSTHMQLCKQMLALLPQKIAALRYAMEYSSTRATSDDEDP